METTDQNPVSRFFVKNQTWILILVGFASLSLLIRQNWLLRDRLKVCVEQQSFAADKLRLSRDLMQLMGEPLPFASRLRDAAENDIPNDSRIVVVFSPMVCGKRLHEHLAAIRSFQERLGPERVAFLGLVGADTREDQRYTLSLRSSNLMTFPFSYVRSRDLLRFFPLESKKGFIETPIYLLVGRDFRIKSVFMPDSLTVDELELWLETRAAA